MKALFGLILVGLCSVMAYRLSVRGLVRHPYLEVCALVGERIYLENARVGPWEAECRERSRLANEDTPVETIVTDLRWMMNKLGVSHLEIYNDAEARRIWKGEDRETGLDSEFVDGELVIFRVHPGSPAEAAELRAGDVILSIQDQHPAPGPAANIGGPMRIKRLGRPPFEIELEPAEITLDESPQLIDEEGDVPVLRIPSFRAQFFDDEKWRTLQEKIRSAKRLVVDLRGNAGGNFVAGLRFLAPFMCGEQEVGYLLKPRSPQLRIENLPDDLDDLTQLEVLDRAEVVQLRTTDPEICLTARVAVLVDSSTASTAELAAQALRDYLDARVYGVSTAGQLLVGVWYDLPALGPGWKISIPEAVYQTRRGVRLEGRGVKVDREVYYNLPELQRGRDSWVERAREELRREKITDHRRSKRVQDSGENVSR